MRYIDYEDPEELDRFLKSMGDFEEPDYLSTEYPDNDGPELSVEKCPICKTYFKTYSSEVVCSNCIGKAYQINKERGE